MALPELIEIVPPLHVPRAEVTVPGSKSITNRALILAALGSGETRLPGALWSEDTQVMVECLQKLGFQLEVRPDLREPCNRDLRVWGRGGEIPLGGSRENPLELFVGNAGTAARFIAALVCLGKGSYRLRGVPRMHERPQAALFRALRELGYEVESERDKLPAVIHGAGPRRGRCSVSIAESSQFASALLLCAKAGEWQVEVTGENAEESPYVEMTNGLRQTFAAQAKEFAIPPDASSASYFWAAGHLLGTGLGRPGAVTVANWKTVVGVPYRQIDAEFPRFLPLPEGPISRESDLGDSIMTAIAIAPLAEHPVRFTELGRLRLQECERVAALRTELTRCGARVVETGDTLEIWPSTLRGAEIETYHDHRMAMCFAILGLRVPGMRIRNPACVKKTFPNFFQKLAASAPAGLGIKILEARSGLLISDTTELFAD